MISNDAVSSQFYYRGTSFKVQCNSRTIRVLMIKVRGILFSFAMKSIKDTMVLWLIFPSSALHATVAASL